MTSPQRDNPVVQQRRLRSALRDLREGAHLVQKDVAKALEWSVSKLVRIENGAVRIDKEDLNALLAYYGVTDAARLDPLMQLHRSGRQKFWWDDYRAQFGQQFITVLGCEMAATVISDFHVLTVPDLLQTREYAAAVITGGGTPDQITVGVDVLVQRQRVIDHPNPPTFFFVIDEGALRRRVGSPAVMHNQLEWLKQMNRRSNITIQISRYDSGPYCSTKGPFTVYELPHEKEDYVIVQELANGDILVLDNPENAAAFMANFSKLKQIAAPTDETDKIIDEILASLPVAGQTT